MRTLAACVVATVVVGAVGGCGRASEASMAAQAPSPAGPRVLLIYDMEGITDAVRPGDVIYGSPTYEATRESLVEDVNAAIRGLLRAGASEVVLADGHGSGNPNPDYILDRLPEGARHDIRDEPYDPYIETMDGSFAAVVTIAMHSKAGTNGFLAHTYNGHTRWVMGGHDMNESMLVAASAARFGIPLILVTGDDVLQCCSTAPATSATPPCASAPPGIRAGVAMLRVLPRILRNGMHDSNASHGYRWFGRRDECTIPTAELRRRCLHD